MLFTEKGVGDVLMALQTLCKLQTSSITVAAGIHFICMCNPDVHPASIHTWVLLRTFTHSNSSPRKVPIPPYGINFAVLLKPHWIRDIHILVYTTFHWEDPQPVSLVSSWLGHYLELSLFQSCPLVGCILPNPISPGCLSGLNSHWLSHPLEHFRYFTYFKLYNRSFFTQLPSPPDEWL